MYKPGVLDISNSLRPLSMPTLFHISTLVSASPLALVPVILFHTSIQLIRHDLLHILCTQPRVSEPRALAQISPLHPVVRKIVQLRRARHQHPDAAKHLRNKPLALIRKRPPTHARHQQDQERGQPQRIRRVRDDVLGVLDVAAAAVAEPDGFLRLQRFAEHPVRQDRVRHYGEEDLFGELQEVVLVERGAGHEGRADALAAVFEFAPVGFLGNEGNVVYHHQVEERVDELSAVGAMGFV
jgi:hypothetical protein